MLIVILIVGLILRFILINQSFWLDEAINVVSAEKLGFLKFIIEYPIGDFHPPGYFTLLWVWGHLFGFSEISVRLISVILGVATIYLTYLIGKKLFNRNTALLASLMLALSPLHIYYSQEARMYALSAFSAVFCFYFYWKVIKQERWARVGYFISLVAVFYSDYVTYLIIPVQLIFILRQTTNIRKRFIMPWFLSLLVLVPWIFTLSQQLQVGQAASLALPEWKKAAGGANLKNILLVFTKTFFGRISFDNKILYGTAVLVMSIISTLVIFKRVRKGQSESRLLFYWLTIPIILAFLLSFYIPVLSYFRVIFILPAFYLLLALGLDRLSKKTFKVVLVVFFVMVSLISLTFFYQNPKFQREDWKGAVNFMEARMTDKSVVLFEDNHVIYPFLYYAIKTDSAYGGLKRVQAKGMEDIVNLESILDDKIDVYLFEYLIGITDPGRLLETKIVKMGYIKADTFNFHGVGFIHYFQK